MTFNHKTIEELHDLLVKKKISSTVPLNGTPTRRRALRTHGSRMEMISTKSVVDWVTDTTLSVDSSMVSLC